MGYVILDVKENKFLYRGKHTELKYKASYYSHPSGAKKYCLRHPEKALKVVQFSSDEVVYSQEGVENGS